MAKKKRFLKKDLDGYKEKLYALRDELYSQIKDMSENNLMKSQKDISGDLSGHTLHMADVAGDHYEREFNLGLMSNEKEQVHLIDEALRRIDDNTYGICQKCDKDIPKQRLDAVPHALYCLKCQKKLEEEERT